MKLLLVLNILFIFGAIKVYGSGKCEFDSSSGCSKENPVIGSDLNKSNDVSQAKSSKNDKFPAIEHGISKITQNMLNSIDSTEIIGLFMQKLSSATHKSTIESISNVLSHKSSISDLKTLEEITEPLDKDIINENTRLSSLIEDSDSINDGRESNLMDIDEKMEEEAEGDELKTLQDLLWCNYSEIDGAYACSLEIYNPNGNDEYEFIEGEHLPNLNNSHVELVVIMMQQTLNIPSIICRQFPNLQEFRVLSNSIDRLSSNALVSCQNLMRFQANFNTFYEIPEDFFVHNQRLMKVVFESQRLEALPAGLFQNNPQVTEVSFAINWLRELPPMLFNGLRFLRTVSLQQNMMYTINAESFGSSIFSLSSLNLNNNRLVSIDRNFWNQTRNLEFLHLKNNLCISEEYFWVGVNRWTVERELERCFANFGTFMRCNFENPPTTCLMSIYNPTGRDDFDRVEGVLPPGIAHFDVTSVEIFWENTTNIPSRICFDFSRITDMIVIRSGLMTITQRSFSSCWNLNYLNLAFNPIKSISDQTFSSITSLRHLSLPFNEISSINLQTFIGINWNLQTLNLRGNAIRNLDHGVFSDLRNIEEIDLGFNQIRGIYAGSFGDSLRSLKTFHAEYNRINLIDAAWFENSIVLDTMNADKNLCIDRDFLDIQNSREQVRNELEECFENFEESPIDGSFIRCLYSQFGTPDCIMRIHNPNGRDDFAGVEGQLPQNRSHSEVLMVEMFMQNTSIIPSIICTQFPELSRLLVGWNEVQTISDVPFRNCSNLKRLDLHNNKILTIPNGSFRDLSNLMQLEISSLNIKSLGAGMFEGLTKLTTLVLAFNSIEEIQYKAFDELPLLDLLDLNYNNIKKLDSKSFGGTAKNIQYFYASSNQINEIDSAWFDNSINLIELGLSSNLCIDERFISVNRSRNSVRNQLQGCFDNFKRPPDDGSIIECQYTQINGSLDCNLIIVNQNGRDDFERVGGQLPSGESYENVKSVRMFYMVTRNIPSIICRQFTNLRNFVATWSGIEIITPASFEYCRNLESILMTGNNLRTIPDGSFRNLANLKNLELIRNQITVLEPNAFVGLSEVRNLDLQLNSILEFLFGTFEDLRNLDVLNIAVNRISIIDSRSFGASARNLTRLIATSNRINQIDPVWFENSQNLESLDVGRNFCVNKTFERVGNDREFVKRELRECFDNFGDLPEDGSFIRCTYRAFGDDLECLMEVYNPNGRDDARGIEGQLPSGRLFEDVKSVYMDSQHTLIFPSIICRQFPSLEYIYASSSKIQSINSFAFEDCKNVTSLSLPMNEISVIPSDTFYNMSYLTTLDLHFNNLTAIGNETLFGLSRLTEVDVNFNSITELQRLTFWTQRNLKRLSIKFNYLSGLEYESFYESISSLEVLEADFNQISSIESSWFENATNLETLTLAGNACTQQNFFNISSDRDFVRNQLRGCFDTLDYIRCTYEAIEDVLQCNMDILNPRGRDDFERIEGQLPLGQTFEDVQAVFFVQNLTLNVPSIICRQFPELKELKALTSQIEVISHAAFENCHNLEVLNLAINEISSIPAGTFRTLVKLKTLNMPDNKITSIGPGAFVGLEELEVLSLSVNPIVEIQHGALDRLRKLRVLYLQGCRMQTFDSRSFGGSAGSLRQVYANLNQINGIDSFWFENAINLELLELRNNLCVNLRFDNVTSSRDFVRNQMQTCFENFHGPANRTFIRCHYTLSTPVECLMDINNPNGQDDFTSIEGEFPENVTSADVKLVEVFKQVTTIVPQIICTQFRNLEVLIVFGSGVQYVDFFTFKSCRSLIGLSLAHNQISVIQEGTFINQPNLIALDYTRNWVRDLRPGVFEGIEQLQFLLLTNNLISVIPHGTFDGLNDLQLVDITRNNISTLDLRSFGSSASSIQTLSAGFNRINRIDRNWFESSVNLQSLDFSFNLCIDMKFDAVNESRDLVREQLRGCFENFDLLPDDDGFIRCRYSQIDNGLRCQMSIDNPNGRDNFERIDGELPPSSSFDDVKEVTMFIESAYNIPSIICNQFPQLELISATSARIQSLAAEAFRNCQNLKVLEVRLNSLKNIEDGTFVHLTNLRTLNLHWNQLTIIGPDTFIGLDALEVLDLSSNQIEEFPVGTFNIFSDLYKIDISWNWLKVLDYKTFGNSLRSIQDFTASFNRINMIDPQWFETAEYLESLDLFGNSCVSRQFEDVNLNRETVKQQLQTCFNNFNN